MTPLICEHALLAYLAMKVLMMDICKAASIQQKVMPFTWQIKIEDANNTNPSKTGMCSKHHSTMGS
jgi:hypothetical protein